jgi:uncharacterized SAM-binding protein YcdF (DUF218 family)
MQNKIIVGQPAQPPAPSSWLNRLFWLLVLCALVLTLLLFRVQILTRLARFWIVNDPLPKADAILVVGGRVDLRPFAAAQLYREGRAPLVLVAQPEMPRTARMGFAVPEFSIARSVLIKEGVPGEAIRMVGTNLTSTVGEALALRAWLTNAPIRSVLIPTDPFNTRRVRRIFNQTLQGTGVQASVAAIEMQRYRADNWWKTEEGAKDFVSEAAKFVHYLTH